MEVEFRGSQPFQIGVLNKASAFRAIVVFREMREGSSVESKGYTFTFYVLLADTSHDLVDVVQVSF